MNPIAVDIFANFLYDLVKIGIAKLKNDHPIKSAVIIISGEFKEIEGLSNILEEWLKKKDVQKKLEEFSKGERDINIKVLSKAFIREGFYFGAKTQRKVYEIIERFFYILNNEYLKSKEGHIHLSERQEKISRKILYEERKTQRGIAEVDAKVEGIYSSLAKSAQSEVWKEKYADQFTKRIDEARNLINQGKVGVAKELHKKLIDEVSKEKEISPLILFRIHNNLGCCEFELGLEKEAAHQYELAHSILPEDKKGLANMAIAQMLKGDPGAGLEYVDRILKDDPYDIHGICVKANLLNKLKEHDKGISLFKEKDTEAFSKKLLENAQCCYTLGAIYYEKGDYESAKKFLEMAVSIDSSIPDYHALLGLSICVPLFKKKFLPWLVPEEIRSALQKAEEYLTQAIQFLKGRETDKKLAIALVNRSSIRIVLYKLEEAANDCITALLYDKHNPLTYRNFALTRFLSGKQDDAICNFIKAIENGDSPTEDIPMIAYAYLSKNPPESIEAIKIIEKYFPEKDIKLETLQIKILLAECYTHIEEYQKAEQLLKELYKTFPDNPMILLSFAKYSRLRGDKEKEESYLLKAFQYADEFEKQLVSLEIANYYRKEKLCDKAIIYYEKVVNPLINNDTLNDYLICLYYSSNKEENHFKCLEICKSVRKKYGITKLISEIEAAIQENLGNLECASELYSELIKIEPDKYILQLRYGLVEFRRGKEEETIKIFEKIKNKVQNDAISLISIAQVFDYVGKKRDAIQLSYKALQLLPSDPNIHLAYIHLFLSLDNNEDELLNPSSAIKDTVVILKVDKEEKNCTLVDSPEINLKIGEISTESRLGKVLLGCKKGDKILLDDTPMMQRVAEILEIKSKYVKTFQDSIQNFNIQFLGEDGLKQVSVGDDFKNIFRIIDEGSERASQISDFYKQRRLTIGEVANLLGKNLFDVWIGLISIPDLSLNCSLGTEEEQREESNIAITSQRVIVDLIALFTLSHIDCLDILPKLFQEIYVAQASLDEIIQIIGMQDLSRKKGRMTIGKYKGQYIREEISSEDVQRKADFLNKIKDFLLTKTKRIGLDNPLSFSEKNLQDILGKASLDTLKIAKENNLSLYSDDRLLRELADIKYKVKGFNIQSLLGKALNQNIIQDDEYNGKIIKLILSKYTFISISGRLLLFSATKSGFDTTSTETNCLFQNIESTNTSLKSALDVLSDFVRLIWLEPLPSNKKVQYIDLSLHALTKKRGMRNTIEIFKKIIERKVTSGIIQLPYFSEISRNIDTWVRSQLLIY